MSKCEEKIEKLIEICRLYYEQDKTQFEISSMFNVSRPLISRMLKEAKQLGIVNIEIRSPLEEDKKLLEQLCKRFQLKNGVIVPSFENDILADMAIAESAIEYMIPLKREHYGIGWGMVIGELISVMESKEKIKDLATSICPLQGNSEVSNRNYHSNELVRIFAEQTGATPNYLYAPAFVEADQELTLFKGLENYRMNEKAWDKLEVAIVNIGNYPSVPDFASVARFGDLLTKRKAVGMILNYYLDEDGAVIASDKDFSIQIPLEMLSKTEHVIGICGSNIKPKALRATLNSGILNHLIATEDMIKSVLTI